MPIPFDCGTYVYDATDPRHVARVMAYRDMGVTMRVRWRDTGWISDIALPNPSIQRADLRDYD